MTTEHISVPREELLGIAVELEENAVAQTGAASRQSLTSAHKIRHILSRATPSDDDFYCCNGVDCGCQGITKREYAEACSKNPSAPRVVTEDMALAVRKEWESWAHSGHTLNRAWIEALNSFVTSLPEARVPDVKAMVERFLGWRLPKDFAPDGGVSFERHYITLIDGRVEKKEREPNSPWWPVGTNLLTADQAEQMFRYVLAAAPKAGEK